MGKEFERKFRASVKQMTAIMEEYAGFREITMETVYFDTYEDALSQRKWMLRRRMENGVAVCTLKTPGENGVRNEWEVPCDDIAAAIPELCKLGAPAELESLTAKGLTKVGSARFTRQAALIEAEGCTVELALDRGILQGGARIEFLLEAEVELKSGSQEAAVAFAQALAAKYYLIPQHTSKYRRALDLAGKD